MMHSFFFATASAAPSFDNPTSTSLRAIPTPFFWTATLYTNRAPSLFVLISIVYRSLVSASSWVSTSRLALISPVKTCSFLSGPLAVSWYFFLSGRYFKVPSENCRPPSNLTLSAGSAPLRSHAHSAVSFHSSVLPDLDSPLPFHWPTNSLNVLIASVAGSAVSARAVVEQRPSKAVDASAMRKFMRENLGRVSDS